MIHFFQYQEMCSDRNVALTVALTWLLGCVQALFPVYLGIRDHWNPELGCDFPLLISLDYLVYFVTYVMAFGQIAGIVAIYFKIFTVSLCHRRRIASTMVESSPRNK